MIVGPVEFITQFVLSDPTPPLPALSLNPSAFTVRVYEPLAWLSDCNPAML